MIKKPVVLLVEDNPADRELTLLALKSYHVTVVVAEDGNEAVDYLFRRNKFSARPREETPDLVILDLKLPKREGLMVLHYIRGVEETRLTPVVILSGFGSPETFATAASYQTAEVLTKPATGYSDLIHRLARKYLVDPGLALPPTAAPPLDEDIPPSQ